MTADGGPELTPIELLVLDHAGEDLSISYGAVQLYANLKAEEELVNATESALLRLFDLGLVRFVLAPWETGWSVEREGLMPMTRAELLAELQDERPDTLVFYDLTPAGEALMASVAQEQIPRVSGNVRRPWLERRA